MEVVKYDLMNDLSKLTTIPKNTLAKLSNIAQSIIASDVYTTMIKSKDDVAEINLGLGILYIGIKDNIQYKFVPSGDLEVLLKDTINNRVDPLKVKIEETLVNRILNAYKDLL